MESEFNIKKCNMNKLPKNAKILVIGRIGCGSTSIMKNLARHYIDKEHYNSTYIISENIEWENFYPEKLPCVISNYDHNDDYIENIWNKQKEKIKRIGYNSHKLLLIIDTYRTYKDKNVLIDILMNARHYNVTIIIGMYQSVLNPVLRSTFDLIFLCVESSISNMKRIYEHYGGMFPTFDMFRETMNSLTKDYSTMVIQQHNYNSALTTTKELVEHSCCWFKAKRYKQLNIRDWDKMQKVLNTHPLWSKLHKDLKHHMIKFFYENSF